MAFRFCYYGGTKVEIFWWIEDMMLHPKAYSDEL